MPDKWEYPWYAAWDLAFHVLALNLVDEDFGKQQLDLMLQEKYIHPSGQLPAYEWNFGDVNPPVHAWAALRVYQIERKRRGSGDREFLERTFHKLLLNFTWWVNRKDRTGKNVFEGGFLGLDNIGVFDRSAPLPTGGSPPVWIRALPPIFRGRGDGRRSLRAERRGEGAGVGEGAQDARRCGVLPVDRVDLDVGPTRHAGSTVPSASRSRRVSVSSVANS